MRNYSRERAATMKTKVLAALIDGKPTTTIAIAKALGVCERTVFRHIARLRAEGHKIDGEAGVGLMLRVGANG